MNKLENARKEINRIDKEITKLFEERMKQMEDVIIYKMENNLQILDAGREKEVIERNCKILVNKELEKYYSGYRNNDWEYLVDIQEGQEIEVVDHGTLQFTKQIEGKGYYIVYSWGDGNSLLSEIDIRGH